MDYRKQAYYIRDVLGGQPIALATTKKPLFKWKHLQEVKLTNQEIEKHYGNCSGLALLTGIPLSPFFCVDGDYKNQLANQDYHSALLEKLSPNHDIKNLYVNSTASKVGKHIWFRIPENLKDKSRKLVTRMLTVPEVTERYNNALALGGDPNKTSSKLLSNPVTCVIESRMTGSYGVFESDKYNHLSGDVPTSLTKNEYWDIIEILYSMDQFFSLPAYYKGKARDYRYINEFNSGVSGEEILDIVLSTGLFTDAGQSHDGNYKFKSTLSSNPHSGYIFNESGFMHCFSHNCIFGEGTKSPHEVVQICNSFTDQETLDFCIEWCDDNFIDINKNHSKPVFKF